MKRLLKRQAMWTDGPVEKVDPMKQYFIDNFGEEDGLEAYKDINSDNVTYIEEGQLSIDSVESLKGFSGENHQWTSDGGFGKYSEEGWNQFLNDIKSNGIKDSIELVVTENGSVLVFNGNHRLQAAIQLNLSDVPVIVKYRDHSEENYKVV